METTVSFKIERRKLIYTGENNIHDLISEVIDELIEIEGSYYSAMDPSRFIIAVPSVEETEGKIEIDGDNNTVYAISINELGEEEVQSLIRDCKNKEILNYIEKQYKEFL